MKFMERQGVVWDDCHEIFRKQVERKRQFTISVKFFNRVFPEPTHTAFGDIMSKLDQSSGPWLTFKWTGSTVQFLSSVDRPYTPHKWEALRGRFKGDKGRRIEMLYSNDEDADYRDLLSQLPLSALQCFISAFGAVHMYGNAMAEGRSYEWTGNNPPDVSDACNLTCGKDILRGISFRSCDAPRTREAYDTDSTFVRADRPAEWLTEYWEMAMRNSCQIIWTEEREKTNLLKTTRGFLYQAQTLGRTTSSEAAAYPKRSMRTTFLNMGYELIRVQILKSTEPFFARRGIGHTSSTLIINPYKSLTAQLQR